MPRESKLPKHLQPMLATLTDAPFDDPDWVF
jgi:bifunctional non-homologous end joining protein LigD